MKPIHNTYHRGSLTALILLCSVSIFSPLASAAAEKTPSSEVVVHQSKPRDYKDEFLSFVLEKTEKYSDKAEDALGKAVDVAVDEAPKLAAEFLRWRFWKHVITATVIILGAVFVSVVSVLLFKKSRDSDADGEEFVCCVGGGLFAFGAIVMWIGACTDGLSNFLSAVQIAVAPKIYLMEQIAGLIHR